MTTYIGLLRAVNLAGRNKVRMADLRDLLTELGMEDPRTLLQSGNLVFRAASRSPKQLERTLERETEKRLDLRTDFFVRTAREWTDIIAGNPFPEEAERDPSHLLVTALKKAPGRAEVKALQQAISGRESVRADGRCAYIYYPDGIGRSRLTTAVIEKQLGTRGTARNWNTVLKLGALAEAS